MEHLIQQILIHQIPWTLRRIARFLRVVHKPDFPFAAGVTEDGTLILSNGFAELPESQQVGVLMHEIMHLILRHHKRVGEREPNRWNYACDCRINLVLQRDGYDLPDWIVLFEKVLPGRTDYSGLTEEQTYDLLEQEGVDYGGEGDIVFRGTGEIDKVRAEALGNMINEIPGDIAGEIGIDHKPTPAPYKPMNVPCAKLARALRSKTQRKSYAYPAHSVDPSLILPSTEPAEPVSLCVLVDVSGSMDNASIERGFTLARRYLAGRRNKVRLLLHDTRRVSDKTMKASQLRTPTTSGGGTSLKRSLDGVKCDLCIIVSDMESDDGLPSPDFPVFYTGTQMDIEGWTRL